MSEDGTDAANGIQQQEEELDEIPKYSLYIRASLIDNETQGACPMSQQGFMLSYILAQQKNVDFKVWTVSQVNPPADFKEKNRAKIYPFVEGISGKNTDGESIEGWTPDNADDVDNFFTSVNCSCPLLKRPRNTKDHILGKVDSISSRFNAFMKGTKQADAVTSILQRVEDHLASNADDPKITFLESEDLSYTDCFLLPRLQHIIVAGKYFLDYEIPASMKNLWRYLRDAYDTPAFSETLPTDDDLLKFHWERLNDKELSEYRRKGLKGRFGVDPNLKKTCSIPPEIEAMLKNEASNGGAEDEQQIEMPDEGEMQQEQE